MAARATESEALRRWRLMLGRYAAEPLSHAQFNASDWKLEQALEYLYGREYESRGLVGSGAAVGLTGRRWSTDRN